MAGRVLIVDPVVTTRIMLKVKLAAAYFSVAHAATAAEAVEVVQSSAPDIVISEMQLPDGDAIALQAQLAAHNVPVVAVLPEDAAEERVAALAAGIGDVISRPYEDRKLLARVRNLMRASTAREELRLRKDTSASFGLEEPAAPFLRPAHVAIVSGNRREAAGWHRDLSGLVAHRIDVLTPQDLVAQTCDRTRYDAMIVAVGGASAEQELNFLSSLRAHPQTRHTAILAVSPPGDSVCTATALDTGAGDAMSSGFEAREAAMRIDRLLKRRQQETQLRRSMEKGLEAAVTDPLTGLYNRRYAMPYLDRMQRAATRSGRSFAIMLLDLDYFKSINDTHGHPVGDQVLCEFAHRLRGNLRSMDLVARLGGEEFLVAMPDTTLDRAKGAAARLCELTRAARFATDSTAQGVHVSVSVGLALGGAAPTERDTRARGAAGVFIDDDRRAGAARSINELLEEADRALYDAKHAGRDTVMIGASAA